MRLKIIWTVISIFSVSLLLLSACGTTETNQSSLSGTEETTITEESSATTQETEEAGEPSQTTSETGGTTESEGVAENEEPKGVSSWVMAGEPAYEFNGVPNDQIFTVELISVEQIDSKGGEFIFKVMPVNNLDCSQTFMVGWEFETDIETVEAGQTINVNVFNSEVLTECYNNAKASMAYGGELLIELAGPGTSHFQYQDAYKKYHEGYSQYLFVLSQPTGAVGPVGGAWQTVGSASGAILVKDGNYEIGEFNAEYGNFSFIISMGAVFSYTVTYHYEAVKT